LEVLHGGGRGGEEEHERDDEAGARVVRVAAAWAAVEAAAGEEQGNAEHGEPDRRGGEDRRRGEADGLRRIAPPESTEEFIRSGPDARTRRPVKSSQVDPGGGGEGLTAQ